MSGVRISDNAIASAAAALTQGPKIRTDDETRYDLAYRESRLKPEGHLQKDLPDSYPPVLRLYTVTTIASSPRYGGTRTPIVCTSFEGAKRVVEENEGDIYEYSYMFAVIEAVVADRLYGTELDELYWYKWVRNDNGGQYQAIETPPGYEEDSALHGLG